MTCYNMGTDQFGEYIAINSQPNDPHMGQYAGGYRLNRE